MEKKDKIKLKVMESIIGKSIVRSKTTGQLIAVNWRMKIIYKYIDWRDKAPIKNAIITYSIIFIILIIVGNIL